MNVQHNCARNKCQLSASNFVRQERQLTTQTRQAILHLNPADLVLNTARMRDSVFISVFRKKPTLNGVAEVENAILEGATKEIHARKETVRGVGQQGRGRGRGQMRGHAQPQRRGGIS